MCLSLVVPLPGEAIDIKIDVTGNGYLWIYELKNTKMYSLIYPNIKNYTYKNEIYIGETFSFSDKNGITIFAGEKEGEETLLFVVTSIKKYLSQTLSQIV